MCNPPLGASGLQDASCSTGILIRSSYVSRALTGIFARGAGLVSLTLLDSPLFGLPHMHRRQPAAARFVGHLSAERDPMAYLGAVQSLLAWWRDARQQGSAQRATPLILNTPGWIKVPLFVQIFKPSFLLMSTGLRRCGVMM